MTLDEDFEASFALALARKDAGLVLDAAGIELPVIRAVAEQIQRAVEAGHGDEDMAAVVHAARAGTGRITA